MFKLFKTAGGPKIIVNTAHIIGVENYTLTQPERILQSKNAVLKIKDQSIEVDMKLKDCLNYLNNSDSEWNAEKFPQKILLDNIANKWWHYWEIWGLDNHLLNQVNPKEFEAIKYINDLCKGHSKVIGLSDSFNQIAKEHLKDEYKDFIYDYYAGDVCDTIEILEELDEICKKMGKSVYLLTVY